MLPTSIKYPAAYLKGYAYFFERSGSYSNTYFGGPSDVGFQGKNHGSEPLHHVMTLNSSAVPIIEDMGSSSLSLFYGLRYSGCEMSYRLIKSYDYKLLEIEPRTSSVDFPYADYPRLLPYVPLKLSKRVRCSTKRFQDITTGSPVDADSLTVIIPPMFDLGASIWGPAGDAEGVQMIFRCDLKNRTVRALNECC